MKSVISLKIVLVGAVAFLTGCQRQNLSNSPTPQELITDPVYTEQVTEINRMRSENGRPTVEELVRRGELLTQPLEPITSQEDFESRERIEVEIPAENLTLEENEERVAEGLYFPEPVHEGVRVEEFFVEEPVQSAPEVEVILTEPAPPVSPEPPEPDRPFSPSDDDESTDDEAIEDGSAVVVDSASPELQEPEDQEDPEPLQVDIEVEDPEEVVAEEDPEDPDTELDAPEDDVVVSEFAPEVSLRPEARPDNLIVPYTVDSSYQARWDSYSVGPTYTSYTLQALEDYGENLLDPNFNLRTDNGMCPNYNNLDLHDRRRFWLFLASALAEKESGFDTTAQYRESNGNYSRGLFQFGYRSTHAYGCGFSSEMELETNPQKNIQCAIRVMNHWITRDQIMRSYTVSSREGRGLARYWGALRFEYWRQRSSRHYNNLIQIQNRASQLPFCVQNLAPEASIRPQARPSTSE